MRISSSTSRLFILLLISCIAFFMLQAQEIKKKIENGVTVVRNPKTPVPPSGSPSKMTLKEDLVIGKDTKKENYWFSSLNSLAVDDSGNIYTLDPKEIKIRVFDSKGNTLKRIVKDYDPVKVTDADKERLTKRYFPSGDPPRLKIEFPKYYPAVAGLVLDDQGWIYTRTYEKDGQGGVCYDVFNQEGHYIARFSLPENERVVVIKKKKLYCMVRESEEGIPLVKRYRVVM